MHMINKQHKKIAISIIIFVFISFFIRTAWISDDAMITFRSILNFTNGYGMGWNIGERVQVFTHPLWFFLLSGFHLITGELFYTTIVVSILISAASIWVLTQKIATSLGATLLGVVALALSRSFIDFSTSGLENPLSFLLLALFIHQIYSDTHTAENTHRHATKRRKPLIYLIATCSLITLNRFDLALIIAPAIVFHAFANYRFKQILIAGLIGSSPLILWMLFSLTYFGYPFPNTAYAKLSTGIPSSELILQGLMYVMDSLSKDPVTLMMIGLSSIIAIGNRNKKDISLVIGVLLYLLYTVKVGGDFMSGRFFSVPLFVTVAVFSRQKFFPVKVSLGIIILFVILGMAHHSPALFNNDNYKNQKFKKTGIADERGFYYQRYGLLNLKRTGQLTVPEWIIKEDEPMKYRINGAIGKKGVEMGPNIHIVDMNAIADPLLSHLKQSRGRAWRIGHFGRQIPKGYLESLKTGENQIEEANLAQFYDQIKIITQAPIFSWERFKTILTMNTGGYKHLINNNND